MYTTLAAIAGDAAFVPPLDLTNIHEVAGREPVPYMTYQNAGRESGSQMQNITDPSLNSILGLSNDFQLPQPSDLCTNRYDKYSTCYSYQGPTYGDYVIPTGYPTSGGSGNSGESSTSGGSTTANGMTTSGGSMQFDDPDLDDEFYAYTVIRNVDFPGHVGRKPETRPDHKDYKGVQIEPGIKAKGVTVVKTPNSMIG